MGRPHLPDAANVAANVSANGAHITPTLPMAETGQSDSAPESDQAGTSASSAPPGALIDPDILRLYQTPSTVFDMREEVYRVANSNGIAVESIHFYGEQMQLNTAGGDKVNASAFAQPSLRDGQRICDIRVVRPVADRSYQPGQPTNELMNLRRRTTIAHELSHCVDWYNGGTGWLQYKSALPQTPDALLPADQLRRWREEVADIQSIILLRHTFGEETARLASKVVVLERQRTSSPWYRHAWVPLASGEPLAASRIEDSERIVAKYWGSGTR